LARSGRGGTRKVEAAFEDAAARYADHGLHVSWPGSAEVVSMAIMGATKSKDLAHTLFVSVRAVESGLLDGLIAHEMGHMLRTESGHPSHSAEVFQALSREVRIPRAAEGAFGQAFNHIQDIYADDLAFLVFATDGDDRAYEFFSGWIEGNATMRGGTAGRTSASRQRTGSPWAISSATVASRKTIRCGIVRARSTGRPVWKSWAPSQTSTRTYRRIRRPRHSFVK